MQPITIRFTFTYRDVLKPGLMIYVKRPMFWLLMLLSVLCIALSFFLQESYFTLRMIGFIGMLVPVSLFILTVLVRNRRLNGKEIIYNISEKGLELELPGEKQEQGWDSVTRVIEEDEHIMLFCSSQRAHIIPKRAFITAVQLRTFIDLIIAKRPDLAKDLSG